MADPIGVSGRDKATCRDTPSPQTRTIGPRGYGQPSQLLNCTRLRPPPFLRPTPGSITECTGGSPASAHRAMTGTGKADSELSSDHTYPVFVFFLQESAVHIVALCYLVVYIFSAHRFKQIVFLEDKGLQSPSNRARHLVLSRNTGRPEPLPSLG